MPPPVYVTPTFVDSRCVPCGAVLQPAPWRDPREPVITLLIVDIEFLGGMILVATVFVVMIVLVVVSRMRIERFHREGPQPFEPRISEDRRE
jgi:hypothetical protein